MSAPDQHSANTQKTDRPRVIGMILAYNCGRMLPAAYERIPLDLVDDIFVTDDGSTDDTYAVAQALGLKVVRHTPNRGYGGNVKAGLAQALEMGADYVVEIHGDGAQFNPASIAFAANHMKSGADFILGSRFTERGRALANGMPLVRFIANQFLSLFDRAVLRLPLTEFHTGFRIYGRHMLETIPFQQDSDDYLFSFQIIAQAAYYNLRVTEVPVEADYIAEHTSHKLSGAAIYAVQTFGVLASYLMARFNLRHTAVFPPR